MTQSTQSTGRPTSKIIGLMPALAFLKPYKLTIGAALVALICTSALTLSIGQGLKLIIDDGFTTGSAAMLNQAIILFFGLIVLLSVGIFFRFYLVSWLGERVSADIRKAVFDHVVQLHPSFFETNLSGEIQSRITTDTTLLQMVIGSSVSIALRNILLFFGGITWLFITNPKLTSMVLICVPLVVAPIVLFGRKVRRLSRSSQEQVAGVGAFVGETLQNIKIIQAFNQQATIKDKLSSQVEGAFQVAIKRITQRSWLTTVVIMLVFGGISGMLWVGGHDVLAGRITGGELAAFLFYSIIVASSIGAISEVIGDLQRAAGATERLMELLEAENLIVAPEQPKAFSNKVKGKLTLKNVVFAYPSRPKQPAINGLDLKVESGTSLALVGPSGAGKSTLLELILRFYDPQQGSICLDDQNIRELAPEALREHIAIVPQQPVLFSANVWDNIRFAKPDASDQAVQAAAKAAYADEFIHKLPEGYDSFLGEAGVRLSGGQRQRIAIARAILKNARILLLDEATSALDAESEHMVQKALAKVMQNRTTLVIAHRLATVMNVDRIAVLDQGIIVETGTHQDLIKHSPLYARLAKLQFSDWQVAEHSIAEDKPLLAGVN